MRVERSPVSDLSVNEKYLLFHLADGRSLQLDTLYVALGTSAHSELARMAGAELAPSGCIVVDEHQQTTISGMFAAGAMVEGLDQIAVAAGQARPEQRRVGKECVSTGRSRWSPCPSQKTRKKRHSQYSH